jgi:enoyl-CoA hydratase/carnithine racemase
LNHSARQPTMNHLSKAKGFGMLQRAQEGPVAILMLAASERRNALSQALMTALRDALADVARNSALRCVVLAAEDPVFSAGHDLREIEALRSSGDLGRAPFEALMATCTALMLDVVTHPLPVIACVEGLATAAGCQLVASCDLAVAGDRAAFCTPGVNIGLFCATPSVPLLQTVPVKAAAEMLFTGEPISARQARDIGLVNRVVPAGRAMEASLTLARQIAAKSPSAVRHGKALLAAQRLPGLREAYARANRVMVENLLDADAIEGIGAFLDKRTPNWRA